MSFDEGNLILQLIYSQVMEVMYQLSAVASCVDIRLVRRRNESLYQYRVN
jgi:hypothetical protein